MEKGRIVIVAGAPGTGKSTVSAIIAEESDMEKSVYMHTDDFYHYLRKGAIPPHLPESNEQNLICNRGFFRISKAFCPWWIRCNCRRYYRPVVFKAVVKNCARGL